MQNEPTTAGVIPPTGATAICTTNDSDIHNSAVDDTTTHIPGSIMVSTYVSPYPSPSCSVAVHAYWQSINFSANHTFRAAVSIFIPVNAMPVCTVMTQVYHYLRTPTPAFIAA